MFIRKLHSYIRVDMLNVPLQLVRHDIQQMNDLTNSRVHKSLAREKK